MAKSYLHKGMKLARTYSIQGQTLHRIYNNFAMACYDNGENDSAILYHLRNIAIAQSRNLKIEEATSYNNLGAIFLDLKDFKQAAYYLKKSLQISLQTDDYTLISNGYLNLGTVYLPKTDTMDSAPKGGLDLLFKGLRITEAHNDVVLSRKFFNAIGLFHKSTQHYREAISYFEKALQLKGGRTSDQVALLINLSTSYCLLGDYRKGEEMGVRALEIVRQTNRIQFYGTTYFVVANIYQIQGRYKEASEHYNESIKWLKKQYDDGTRNKVHHLRSQYEIAQKDRDLISKQLKITQQQAQMDKNQIVTIAIVVVSFLTALAVWLHFRYRHRIHQQREQQERELASWRSSLEGEEKERRRLAQELHDNIGGNLSTLKMWFANIRNNMNGNLSGQEQEYSGALQLLDHTLTDVRNTAHHLMPELLLRLGLAEAIRVYCIDIQRATGIKINYEYLGYIGPLGNNTDLLVYRMVQELIQNVVKHAKATELLVQLTQFNQTLSITIEDNGQGVHSEQESELPGMGLASIRDSIAKLNGKFTLQSEPGNGTTIELAIHTEPNPFLTEPGSVG